MLQSLKRFTLSKLLLKLKNSNFEGKNFQMSLRKMSTQKSDVNQMRNINKPELKSGLHKEFDQSMLRIICVLSVFGSAEAASEGVKVYANSR